MIELDTSVERNGAILKKGAIPFNGHMGGQTRRRQISYALWWCMPSGHIIMEGLTDMLPASGGSHQLCGHYDAMLF